MSRTNALPSLLVLAAFAVIVSSSPAAELRLPRIFSDHMVLQRDKPVKVWGWADRGEKLTVEFAGQVKTTTAANDGTWQVVLEPMPVSAEGRRLTVKSEIGNRATEIQDVLVGDVWLGSGQSNMEYYLEGVDGHAEAIYRANHPLIRLLKVPGETSDKPADDIPGAAWKICTPATVRDFSAVGYYFARDVHLATGVPLGMVVSARGGTYPESWQSRQSLESLKSPVVDKLLAYFDKQVVDWVAAPQSRDPRHGEPGLSLPAGCYNFMIHPIEKFTIRGALFYQGENSAVNNGGAINFVQAYPLTYPAVIRDWRQRFGDPDLPFCVIEMAPWGRAAPLTSPDNIDSPSPFVREVHLQTHVAWPHTGVVVTMDCGKLDDMHPLHKEPVGQRAARWALAQVYQVTDRVWTGPLYRALEIKGNRAVIRFHRDGLSLPLSVQNPAGANDGFIIAGADRAWHNAQAAIVGETVEVWSERVPVPVAVRYAWEDAQGQVNLLVNAAGLPASPFRTDRWVTKTKIGSLLDQPLLLPAEGARPWADTGPDLTLLASVKTVTLDGSGSYSPDGPIIKYAWTQRSGPVVNVSGAETKTLTLDSPPAGQYKFRLTVTDHKGLTASREVTVRVIDRSLPVAVAGKNQTLLYPSLGTVLDGSGSHDLFGSLRSYEWTQVSGPNQAHIAAARTAKARVADLVPGTYVFRLTVADNFDKQASDEVTVVAQANPLVNGGFETGDLTGWTTAGDPPSVVQSDKVHSGKYAVLVGNNTGVGGVGWHNLYLGTPNLLANLPANASLSFWVYRRGGGSMNLRVREGLGFGSAELVTPWPIPRGSYNDSDWVHYTVDLSAHAGKTITVLVEVHQTDKHTYMLIDDVQLLLKPNTSGDP